MTRSTSIIRSNFLLTLTLFTNFKTTVMDLMCKNVDLARKDISKKLIFGSDRKNSKILLFGGKKYMSKIHLLNACKVG